MSRHRVRQTSVVFCEARAFLVQSSLICRNSQLASSAVIQGGYASFFVAWDMRGVIAGSARAVSAEGPGLTSLCLWRNAMIILTSGVYNSIFSTTSMCDDHFISFHLSFLRLVLVWWWVVQ